MRKWEQSQVYDAAITLKEIGEKRQKKASRREDRRDRKVDRRK